MRPYWRSEDGKLTLYCADNADVLPQLAGDFDLVFTSPPYNVNVSPGGCGGGFYTPSRGGKAATKWRAFQGYGAHDDALPHEAYVAWQRSVLAACWAALNDRGALIYNHKPRIVFKRLWMPTELAGDLPLHQIVTWDGGPGIAMGDSHFCPSYEWLLVFTKPGFRLRDRAASALGDLWRIPRETRAWGHPAPFPVGLPLRAIEATGARRVLDPFAGSGSTLAAAKVAGVEAVGVEISEAYCEIAVSRLRQGVLDFGAEGAAS